MLSRIWGRQQRDDSRRDAPGSEHTPASASPAYWSPAQARREAAGRVTVVSPDPGGHPADGNLATDVLRGIAAVLDAGIFNCNAPDAEVFVGEVATALRVPPVLQEAVRHLRRIEPTNRRLWTLNPRYDGPIFNALAAEGCLIAPPRGALLRASIEVPVGEALTLRRFNALVIPNELLWPAGGAPRPYAGAIAFAERGCDRPFHVAGFGAAAPAVQPLSHSVTQPPSPDLGWRLLEDLAHAAHRRALGCNRRGSQLFLQGDLAHLVVPAGIQKAVLRSARAYPEPVSAHLDDYLAALAMTGVLRPDAHGDLVRIARVEGLGEPQQMVSLPAAALLRSERRQVFGEFQGDIHFLTADRAASP